MPEPRKDHHLQEQQNDRYTDNIWKDDGGVEYCADNRDDERRQAQDNGQPASTLYVSQRNWSELIL